VHFGTAHMPLVQTLLEQSAPVLHVAPEPHGVQTPPQSTSLSLPFLTPSLQAGA